MKRRHTQCTNTSYTTKHVNCEPEQENTKDIMQLNPSDVAIMFISSTHCKKHIYEKEICNYASLGCVKYTKASEIKAPTEPWKIGEGVKYGRG